MSREDHLFASVKFLVDTAIPEHARTELHETLSYQGGHSASSVFDATHIITNTLDFEGHHDFEQGKAVAVTPLWVKRCIEHQKLQDPKYYSPHPGKIMSGVVATSSDLPRNDVEALCAGIIAYGGQWRHAFTKDVTHLFCLAPQGDKYNTAMHHKDKMGLEVLIPAWFQDCVQLQQRLPTGPYSFPNPARFKPLASLDPIGAGNHPAEGIDSKLKSVSNSTEKNILFRTVSEAEGKQQKPDKLRNGNIWEHKIVLLGKDLGLQDNILNAVEASIDRNGGIVCYDEDKIDDVDFFVCRYRHGETFKRAVTRDITIGTVAWVFHCEQVGRLSRPMDQLCHFPIPITKIKDFDKYEITVTNYTGESRDYLKNLIDAVGARFSATMSKANTHVIAAHLGGQKAERALGWNIPIINHTWLEDCFLEWKNIPIGGVVGSKYSKFPAGINFMSILGERGYLGFQDTDPRKILGESQDAASSSVSNGKQAKRPRLEQVATGSGEVTPQPRPPAGEHTVPSGPSRPPPSAKRTQEPATNGKSAVPSDDHRRDEGDENTPISKRASNAAESSTPRRPGLGESPTPKGAKPPSSTRKKPASLQATDAMDIDNAPGFANTDESDIQLDVAPVAGPSGLGLKKSASRHQRPASDDEDMDRIQQVGLSTFSKPPSKPTGKAKKPSSSKTKQAADATDGPSSSRRVVKAASGPSLSNPPSEDHPSGLPHHLPPELAGLKRSETDPNLLILTTDDETEKPASPKKKPAKKRKVAQAAPVEVVSSAQSSRGASVSEAESAQTDPISAVPGRLKRGAAAKAEAQLRDHVMPDLVRHQKDLKSSQGDVRKLHLAGVPSSSRKRVRGEEPESDGEDSDGDRPSSRKRKVDGPGSSKPSAQASSKGKGKAKAVEQDEGEESESSLSSLNAPVPKSQKKVVIDVDDEDLSDSSTATKKKGRTPWIMTTSYDLSPKDEEKLIKMGAKKADDMTKCTHLVAGKGILRTVKFMAAVASGVQIVTPEWIKACLKAHSFVDSDPYLPKDPAGEKKYDFKLQEALKRAREKKLFRGHKFWITKSLFSDFNDLKTVIQACGGEATKEMVKDRYLQGQSDKRHVISSKEDRIHWNGLPKLGIPVYGKDFVYNSALRQIADWNDAQVWNPNSTDP